MSAEYYRPVYRLFWLYLLVILTLTIAFPIYQLIVTGGWLFYTNGIDEAAYLSYPYATILQSWHGLLRFSNTVIIFLHECGMSGGSINLLFDAVVTAIILSALPAVFRHLGFSLAEAQRCALLTFLLPLLVTPFNPVIRFLATWWRQSSLFPFITMPPNSELLFLRSPEPQISWMIVIAIGGLFGGSRALPWILVCMAPLLYSFISIPVIFCSLIFILPSRPPLFLRLILSFLVTAISEKIFFDYKVDPALHRFVTYSHVPVLPFTALVSSVLLVGVLQYFPGRMRSILVVLVASVWVMPNLQIVSGILLPSSKFEEYWGTVVVAVLAAVMVQVRSRVPNRWIVAVLLWFGVWVWTNFEFNAGILAKLNNVSETIALLHEAPERVASTDLYVSSHLDMVHSMQPLTLFSFTKTYSLSDDRNYIDYRCGKERVRALPQAESRLFDDELAALDFGYAYRGVDEIITMRRRPLEAFQSKASDGLATCPPLEPIFIDLD